MPDASLLRSGAGCRVPAVVGNVVVIIMPSLRSQEQVVVKMY